MSRPRHPAREPKLIIEVPLEGAVRIWLDVRSSGDEIRLRQWLQRTAELRHIESVVAMLLDELDRREAA